ncbi:NUDIX domain-containing protein [Paenibacillus shunpengii]|uniref:NUDIX domain-containing protein n=1 Tax=Paenibacillus shunpengii TaxID=2054424 RepID=A0ABW5SKA4_9BACL|nr:NUDIX domain-containing protein [Paenibacillus sp. PDC88]SDW35000.1 8-oxo-dGTP diphosphatase [Paenibacillus sp. PDC88]
MEVRQMATAYLFNEDKVLMLKRLGSRLHDEAFWTGLGGHLEPEELSHPKEACIREVYEESGIKSKDIIDLELKYILHRIKNSEIRLQYVYFGKTDMVDLAACDEGELIWVPKKELPHLTMSRINSFMLEHYLTSPSSQHIMVGTITLNKLGKPLMQWSELKDPLIF